MTFWGVDLGVRSFHAAGLHPSYLELFAYEHPLTGLVRDQGIWDRVRELYAVGTSITPLIMPGDQVGLEEPPLAGAKNIRTFLGLSQVSGVVGVGAKHGGGEVTFVPVDSWKKGTVGRGGADKELVAAWLKRTYPGYHDQCAGNQNFVDAVCIALYMRTTAALREAAVRTARPGGVGDPRRLAAS